MPHHRLPRGVCKHNIREKIDHSKSGEVLARRKKGKKKKQTQSVRKPVWNGRSIFLSRYITCIQIQLKIAVRTPGNVLFNKILRIRRRHSGTPLTMYCGRYLNVSVAVVVLCLANEVRPFGSNSCNNNVTCCKGSNLPVAITDCTECISAGTFLLHFNKCSIDTK